jgi:hypothetical protein
MIFIGTGEIGIVATTGTIGPGTEIMSIVTGAAEISTRHEVISTMETVTVDPTIRGADLVLQSTVIRDPDLTVTEGPEVSPRRLAAQPERVLRPEA